MKNPRKKVVRAWAWIDENGKLLDELICLKKKEALANDLFSKEDGDKLVPCTITYQPKKGGGK